MSVACRVEQGAVMVDGRCSQRNLVVAVAVVVAYAEVVVAVAVGSPAAGDLSFRYRSVVCYGSSIG